MPMLAAFALSPWVGWRPATCLPADCFCETIGEGFVLQPVNTWSSLAFLLAALWVAKRNSGAAGRNQQILGRAELWLFITALVLVGLGSAFYHASLTFVGQVADVSGMYLVATFMLLHRLGPRWKLSPAGAVFGFIGMNAALMAAQVMAPSSRRLVFALLLLSALGLEGVSAKAGRGWLGGGAALMAMAFVIWTLDRERLVCAPESVLQGHALWHVLGAVATVCLFRCYEADATRS